MGCLRGILIFNGSHAKRMAKKRGHFSTLSSHNVRVFWLSFRFFSETLLLETQNVGNVEALLIASFSSQHFILFDPYSACFKNKTGMKIRKYKHCALPAHRKSHPWLTPTPSSSSPCAASEFARLSKGSAAAPDRSVVCLCNACSRVPEAGGLCFPPDPSVCWDGFYADVCWESRLDGAN